MTYFITTIDMTIVNVSLPTIGRDLRFAETSLQWVATAYALTFGGFLLLGGRFADLLGRRRMLVIGLAVFTGASLGCALSAGEALLITMRAIQGVGAALMIPAALSIITMMFEAGAERNKALGIWGGLGAAGGTVGLIAGGVITRYLGWEYIFYLNVPVGMAALALVPRLIPSGSLTIACRRLDIAGAVSGTGCLVLLVDALAQAPQYGWGAPRTLAVLGLSVATLVAFVVSERRVEEPMVPLSIFRARGLAAANLSGLLLGGSFFAFVFAGTLYMQQALHYSALQTGAAWMTASVTSMALAAASQRLVTRIGATPVMAGGLTLIAIGIVWAAQVPVRAHLLPDLAGPFLVAGAGTAFSFIPISVAALEGVAEHRSGLACGLLPTSTQFGAAIGTAIASSVAASRSQALLHAGHMVPIALTGGFRETFWVLALVALAAPVGILTLTLRRRPIRARAAQRDTNRALAQTN